MVKFNSINYTQILSSEKTNPVPPRTSLPGLPVVSLIFLFLLCCFSLSLLTEKIIKELITSILLKKNIFISVKWLLIMYMYGSKLENKGTINMCSLFLKYESYQRSCWMWPSQPFRRHWTDTCSTRSIPSLFVSNSRQWYSSISIFSFFSSS